MAFDLEAFRSEMVGDEGNKAFPYFDTVNKCSIGIGRNLTDRGLSQAEIDFLFDNDVALCEQSLDAYLPWWRGETDNRQMVILNLCFMGIGALLTFHEMLAFWQSGDYVNASAQLGQSQYHRQVGARCDRLMAMLLEG